jgi:hypothetical protein
LQKFCIEVQSEDLNNAKSFRVSLSGLKVERVNPNAKYTMMKHDADKMNPVNPCRLNLMQKVNFRWKRDGLNSLKFKLIKKERQQLFTWIFVDLLESASQANLTAEQIC